MTRLYGGSRIRAIAMGVSGNDVANESGMMDRPSRPPEATILTRELLIRIGIVGTLLLQLSYTYVPMMNCFFQSAPLDLCAWLRVFALGITAYISWVSKSGFEEARPEAASVGPTPPQSYRPVLIWRYYGRFRGSQNWTW